MKWSFIQQLYILPSGKFVCLMHPGLECSPSMISMFLMEVVILGMTSWDSVIKALNNLDGETLAFNSWKKLFTPIFSWFENWELIKWRNWNWWGRECIYIYMRREIRIVRCGEKTSCKRVFIGSVWGKSLSNLSCVGKKELLMIDHVLFALWNLWTVVNFSPGKRDFNLFIYCV